MTNFYNYTWVDVVKHLNSDSYTGLLESQIDLHKKNMVLMNFILAKKEYILSYTKRNDTVMVYKYNFMFCFIFFK